MEELIPFVTGRRNRLMEVGQYAVEMLPSRDVTVRDSILLDRQQTPISARVTHLQEVTFNTESANVVFF